MTRKLVVSAYSSLDGVVEDPVGMEGSGLVHDLLPAGLVDVIHLLVYPTVLGRGTRLLPNGWSSHLELDEVSELGTGILSLRYMVGSG